MARNMTTVQKASSIRFGSAKFEVGEDLESMVDLGAMRGIEFEESWSEIQVKSDNAGIIIAGINEHQTSLKGDLMEINLTNLALIRGGIDKIEKIAAVPGGDGVTAKKAAIKLLSGGISTFTPRVARVTNYDDAGKAFAITVFKATSASGITISFPESDSEDPAMTPIELTGTPDTSRAIGEQLFEILDEQSVV